MAQRFSTAAKVRPQRRWQMDHHDPLQGGYAHRLPPTERAWLERFDREVYAVDARLVRTGLHADRIAPDGTVDSSRRRALYVEQNAATRDVYSLGRVVSLEDDSIAASATGEMDAKRRRKPIRIGGLP